MLRELHHEDDEGTARKHTGGPEEGVEQRPLAVQPRQDHVVLPLVRVVVAGHQLLRLQTLGYVCDYRVHGRVVLSAFGYVEALRTGFLRLLVVGEADDLPGGVEANEHLQAGVL